jgi:hypothetical protein
MKKREVYAVRGVALILMIVGSLCWSKSAPLGTLTSAQAAQPKWETSSCEYMDLKSDITLTGRCHMESTEINGHFAYLFTWPSGNKVTVEYINSQSGHHIWRLNGEAAAAVEINREHLKGFTLDLNQFLEWEERAE